MAKKKHVDNTNVESFLLDKRNELVWALSFQNYSDAQISRMFNVHRSTILRILRQMPRKWEPKWIKASDVSK